MPFSLIRPTRSRSRRLVWLPEGLHDAILRMFEWLAGAAVILFALALALAIASHHQSDPSWNVAASPSVVHNWLGSVGSAISDIAWQFFGLGSALTAVVLAAWGWRIASGRGLDLLPWRAMAGFASMLSGAAGVYAAGWRFPPEKAEAGGAFGKLLGLGLVSLLPESWGNWGQYGLAALLFLFALLTLYMACALTLGEWHVVAKVAHGVVVWCLRRIHNAAHALWRMLHNAPPDDFDDAEKTDGDEDRRRARDEDDDTETNKPDDDDEDRPAQRADKKQATNPKAGRNDKHAPLIKRPAATARQARLALGVEREPPLPPLDLLQWPDKGQHAAMVPEETLEKNAKQLEAVLGDFGVNGAITDVSPGPVVTLYELEPAPGTRAARVISLADDIARNMSAASVRVAVVPGRNVIGIELPNARRETVYLRELLTTEEYHDTKATLPLVLGKDIAGRPIIADLSRMPHLLIAGTTGSGKSVAINTMILSLIYRLPPQKCRFIMVDPKMLELSMYDGIPHLLAPVVTDPKKAIMALRWTVREMEERYRAMSKLGVRNIEGYNIRLRDAAKNGENLTRTVQTGFDRETGKPQYEEQPLDLTELPYIVVIVDEMADLMIVAGKEIESAVQRLAQMARAAGIHIMMATQRPSVDVITGTIKANFPTRVSFQVTSKIDSRTILGEQGAEQLLGQGDMLYMAGGGRVTRVHGPFVRDQEVEGVVKFLKSQGEPEYLDEVTEDDGQGDFAGGAGGAFGGAGGDGSGDGLYDKAVDIVLRERKASTSFIQRQLQIGYNKAANLVERMEREGVIGPANAMGKREVFGRKMGEDE